MKPFEGTKFRPIGTKIVYNEYGEALEKTEFALTSTYKKYLAEKREEERLLEIETYKRKLEYQYKKYGEVDPVDFEYYRSLL